MQKFILVLSIGIIFTTLYLTGCTPQQDIGFIQWVDATVYDFGDPAVDGCFLGYRTRQSIRNCETRNP